MKKISSFTVNHIDLLRGVYVSRKDILESNVLTTFDIRMKEPNREPVMNNAEIHTIEHLGATYLRNHPDYCEKTIYFGPMGCRTGFYLILKDDLYPKNIIDILINMFQYITCYDGEVPGATDKDCGNYLDMNLPMAKYESKKFLSEILIDIKEENLVYPEF